MAKKRKRIQQYKQNQDAFKQWLASHDLGVWFIVIPCVIAVVALFMVATRF